MEREYMGHYGCGCFIFKEEGKFTIDYCPEHEAAPALYEALETALGTIFTLANGQEWLSEIYPVINKALAQARRK